jgi:hypothetical protein
MTRVDSRYGYFSYGAVGLSSAEYDGFKADLAPVLTDYLSLAPGGDRGFKHTLFKRIPYAQRRDLAERIVGRKLLDDVKRWQK